MTTYAVLGTGAIGGWYGALLAQAGHDVHFLCRSDHAHVKSHGLLVESPLGDIHLREVQAYDDAADMPRCGVALVTWKATSNGGLGPVLASVVAPESTVVMMQNGLGNEEAAMVAAGLEPDRLLAGLSFICAHKVGPGHVRHLDYGAVTLAGDDMERAEEIADDFRDAGVPVSVEPDRVLARWRKLVWNIPYNGLCVLLDATTDSLMADRSLRGEIESLMREVCTAAAACGAAIPEAFVAQMIDDTARMEPYTPSTKLDHERGRPMELEAIFGNPVRAAREVGVEMPRVELLYRCLKYLDTRARA